MTNLPPVQELSEERGMTTKPLEWREYEVDGETAMWEASTNFGTFYLIDAKPDHFELSHNHEPLGIFPAPEDAKIAADADHLCRILPALTELQHSRAAEAGNGGDGLSEELAHCDELLGGENPVDQIPFVRATIYRISKYLAREFASPSATGVRVKPDRDSIRIAQQFADMFRSGAQGAGIDCDAAMSLALALDDILSALVEQP